LQVLDSTVNYAALALEHFRFAGTLALAFAAVTVAYLCAAWQLAGRLGAALGFVLHTLFLGWQSNVAYLAVVALNAGQGCLERAPSMAEIGWSAAPWLVPGAAILYAAMLLLPVLFYALLARERIAS
jgi:hypothetical protein